MAKDKKKKGGKTSRKSGAALKALASNPLVADVVAAALVATASALKDSKRARQLASETGDELRKLAKKGGEDGSALWDMALQIGRRSLDVLTGDGAKPAKKAKPRSATKSAAKKPATKKSSKKPTTRARAK